MECETIDVNGSITGSAYIETKVDSMLRSATHFMRDSRMASSVSTGDRIQIMKTLT